MRKQHKANRLYLFNYSSLSNLSDFVIEWIKSLQAESRKLNGLFLDYRVSKAKKADFYLDIISQLRVGQRSMQGHISYLSGFGTPLLTNQKDYINRIRTENTELDSKFLTNIFKRILLT
jgi:hypothetical protein